MDIKQLQDKKIKILLNLDFEKIKSVYQKLNWKWYFPDEETHIPNVNDLQKTIIKLIDDVIKISKNSNEKVFIAATGGFEVTYDKETNDICVKFVVDEITV